MKRRILALMLAVMMLLSVTSYAAAENEVKLTGTIFGSAPSSSNVYQNAFDGDVNKPFGGNPSGYCGMDLGEGNSAILTKVRLYPRSNNGDMTTRQVGAVIEGANGDGTINSDGTISGLEWETIYTITSAPKHAAWTEYTAESFNVLRKYRYIRFRSSDTEYASVGEIEFYTDPTLVLEEPYNKTGTPFGSASDYALAFDNDTETKSLGESGGYIGLDFGDDLTLFTSISFYPASGKVKQLQNGVFQVGTGNGTIDENGNLTGDIKWVDIVKITGVPRTGWNTITYDKFLSCKEYRYVRFLAAEGKTPAIAELMFEVDPSVICHPDFEVEKGKLLYTVGVMSDFHIDCGIEQWNFPVREDVIDTTTKIRNEENANAMIVTGDITSCHMGANYTQALFNKVRESVRQTMNSATENGYTMYVTGNHEYSTGATNYNSGDYSFIMEEDIGPFKHALYMDDAHTKLLAYHYEIDGLNFIGINTPYNGGENHGDYVITLSSIDFVESVLNEIGQEKLVIVACHYPFNDSRGISSSGKGMSNTSDMNNRLKAVLNAHPNTVYVYGHDHGGMHIKTDTFERVTPYRNDGTVIGTRQEAPSGFVSSFAGSMSYYNSYITYNGQTYSGIYSYGPPLYQALMVYVYDNCVELKMKNYGVINGGSEDLESYVFPKSFSILELVYDVDGNIISDIPQNTTVGELIAVSQNGGYEVKISDNNGEITDLNTPVKSGMTVSRKGTKGETLYTVENSVKGVIKDFEYADGTVTAGVEFTSIDHDCRAVMAVYDENDKLIGINSKEVKKDEKSVDFSCDADECEYIRVFFWNGFDVIKPLGMSLRR